MKRFTKILFITLACVLIAGLMAGILGTAVASVEDPIKAKPGDEISFEFEVPEVYGIDGYFEFDYKALFSSVSYENGNEDFTGNVTNDRVYLSLDGQDSGTASVLFDLKVADDAAPGQSCTITLHFKAADVNGEMGEDQILQEKVIIIAEESSEEPSSEEPSSEEPSSEEPSSEEPSSEEPSSEEPSSEEPSSEEPSSEEPSSEEPSSQEETSEPIIEPGDHSAVLMWAVLAISAVLVLAVTIIGRRRIAKD